MRDRDGNTPHGGQRQEPYVLRTYVSLRTYVLRSLRKTLSKPVSLTSTNVRRLRYYVVVGLTGLLKVTLVALVLTTWIAFIPVRFVLRRILDRQERRHD